MALRAGYKGIKKYVADMLNKMNPGDSFATDAEIAAAANQVRADIAPVLEEAKAPAGGITSGEQFYLNDILYTAMADITSGANIVITGEGKNADVSADVTQQIATKVNINSAPLSNINQIADDIPDVYDYGFVTVDNNVTISITNGKESATSKLVVYRASADVIDWYGKIAEKTFGNGRIILSGGNWIHASFSVLASNDIIGTTEDRVTASRSYVKGEHFPRYGKFCTAITDIASGATLTLNTNYIEGTIADILAVTEGVVTTTNTDVTVDTTVNKVYQQGSFVNVEVKFTLSADISASTVILTLPFVPKQRAHLSLANSDYTITRCVEITTSKNVVSNSLPAGTYTVFGSYFT